MASFLGKPSRQSSTIILKSPPIDSLATIEMFCRRSRFPRVRILQQASVMLGHCRMRSRSKPQLHARSAVGSSGPDEPRGWAGEGRSSPARKSVPANRIDGGWLLDLKGPRRAFYTTKLPAFQNARSAFFFCTPVKNKTSKATILSSRGLLF